MGTTPYSESFFDEIEDGSIESAGVVVPLLLALVNVTSVVDVGCGRGAWLRVFQEHGVKRLRGIDGDYVKRSRMLVDDSCFMAADLTKLSRIDDRYDVALCLEVAEHLPQRCSPSLVGALTSAAPIVLFSAAVPGQSGAYHVNEQWPTFWREIFARQGFRMFDPFRRRLREDCRVKWWYRQNLVLFASEEGIERHPALQQEPEVLAGAELEWVHFDIVRTHRNPGFLARQGLGRAWKRFISKTGRRGPR
jgi:SAM-dependent methyltransferase